MSGSPARPARMARSRRLKCWYSPNSMRGAGEGHYAWDLQPGSMMTNAAVTAVVKAKAGDALTLTYKDGTQKITVPPNAPIVTFAPAERA